MKSSDYGHFDGLKQILIDFVLAVRDYNLDSFEADGAIGLASNTKISYIESLFLADQIPEPIFSLYINDDGFYGLETLLESVLIIGAVDFQYATSQNGTEIPASSTWVVDFKGFILDRTYVVDKPAVIDSTYPFIKGPSSEVFMIYKSFISMYGCSVQSDGHIVCDCYNIKRFANITFLISTQQLTLSPENYFFEVLNI